MNKNILDKAQTNYDFFETPLNHSKFIYDDVKKSGLKVLDVCCGLCSLSDIFYNDEDNEITLIELNDDFIPYLKQKYPRAKIINDDFLTLNLTNEYDIILCNPPFNTGIKKIYIVFFMKLLNLLNINTKLYFICPCTFLINSIKINLDVSFDNIYSHIDFVKENKQEPAKFYFEKFNFIQIDSSDFYFNKPLIKYMIETKIIKDNDIIEYIDNRYMLNETYDIRFLRNIKNFKNTSVKCILLRITI